MAAVEPEYSHSTTGEPETLPEGEVEPSSTPEAETGHPLAEPHPDWEQAKQIWGAAWGFHVYFIGVLFLLMTIFAVINLVGVIRRRTRLESRSYFIALNIMMIIFGASRAILMLVDAYNSNHIFPTVVAYLFMSMGFPCLTSAFYLLFSAIHASTKFRVLPPNIFSNCALVVVIAFNFVLSITADFVVGFHVQAYALLITCQAIFTIWGLLFSGLYFYLFGRLYHGTYITRQKLRRMSSRHCTDHGKGDMMDNPRPKLSLAMKITLVAACFFLIISILNICGMATKVNHPSSPVWGWWAYHFIFRLCEIAMGCTILVVTLQPLRQFRGSGHGASSTDSTK